MLGSSSVSFAIALSTLTFISSEIVEGSRPVLQRTIESLFSERSETVYPDACKWLRSSPRQTKICNRDPGLEETIDVAKNQAISSCEDAFRYDKWNCSLVFNNKPKRNIFNKIYRETAFVFALTAASLSHAVAKGCASGSLVKCSCLNNFGKNTVKEWKTAGCGDDFRYGKRITRNFLDFKHAGNDQIADTLKQNVLVGVEAVGEQLREVCKCHGFSGSCTTKTCWKRLPPFSSAMGLLKKQYHHAVKKKIVNYTTKRAITPKVRKRIRKDRKSLVYLQKTPNLCVSTVGRPCRDRQNCATLCCGRGYNKYQRAVDSRCNCKMLNCCFVKCDTCRENVDFYVCK
ncbi:protein Wnt-4 [Plutella xylostella]|uniref:protein Wnt-4 n=1 Tax=Plutella xylostella TaxID=51655 RepID=UPI0005D0D8B3|nr:protein Wnt-4 [Plutella xylostella]